MSHKWMSHVKKTWMSHGMHSHTCAYVAHRSVTWHVNKSCHTSDGVMSHVWRSHDIHPHTCTWVGHVTRVKESWQNIYWHSNVWVGDLGHTCEWVMPYTHIRACTWHLDGSCHTCDGVVTYIWRRRGCVCVGVCVCVCVCVYTYARHLHSCVWRGAYICIRMYVCVYGVYAYRCAHMYIYIHTHGYTYDSSSRNNNISDSNNTSLIATIRITNLVR